MKVTGYMILDRIEALQERASLLEDQFEPALFRFRDESEQRPDPRELMRAYEQCERKIALLQEAQAHYNLRVSVTVAGETMTLQRAVKLIGTMGRIRNLWKEAVEDTEGRYLRPLRRQRDRDAEYAERVVSVAECLHSAEEAGRLATAFKQAVRAGNATEVDLDLDPDVFKD
ncbi:MAG: hypothetical protein RMJ43_09385 [Chloroherpetonaceae bacterium]|nr:hypothetical protein [Chthonomonadaceae bacterium]MDW8208036.1 hypothetical protein [Chloroherpetonaceae bacterium]